MRLPPEPAPLVQPIFEAGPGSGAIALQAGGQAVTYAELGTAAMAFGTALRRAGVRPGDRVALILPKSIVAAELIIAVLAIGAAYVPLDPRQPPLRLRATLSDLEPALVVATPEIADAFDGESTRGGGYPVATLAGGALVVEASVARRRGLQSDGLAAILYTSGSTGAPKGIMLTHRNLASFVEWAARAFDIEAGDRLASIAPFHFDLSIFDLFCGLTRHATVHLLDAAVVRFPGEVRAWIDAAAITVWYSVPTALARLQQRRALRGIRSLRLVLFAGEVFPVPVLRQLIADLPQPEYINLYGPTETNVCTYYRLPGLLAADAESLPIGRPCEHLTVSLRNAALGEVVSGEIGEICVDGPAVMRGYWRQEAATTASRLPGRPASYRTGDYGRLRSDGQIMFAGRRDHQVKVRGHRVELLALEAALYAHPAVGEAAALAFPDGAGGRLRAFLAPRHTPVPDAEIRRFLAQCLPACYQPDQFEWLPELPRTSSGKCDRAMLLSAFGCSAGG